MPGMSFQVGFRSRFHRVAGEPLLTCASLSSFPYVRALTLPLQVPIPLNLSSVANKHHPQDGSDFMGERLTVQFARGSRQREPPASGGGYSHDRGNAAPRPRRTPHRMQITGLPNDTSWQVC